MKKKIIGDMILNIVASAIPIFVLQLIVLPSLSRHMPSDDYGLLVTILAFLNVVPATLGNVLNNIRILHEGEYTKKKLQGDYNILVFCAEAGNVISLLLFAILYCGDTSVLNIALTTLVAIAWMLREYYIVAFRLIINYKAILINNLIMVGGYVLGYFIFLLIPYWQVIYLCGLASSLVYIFLNCTLWKEPLKRTELFEKITKDSCMLLIAGVLLRVIIYADKILIYPLLGGTMVSIYYASTIFGKVVSLVVTPISSVVLTYLSKRKTKDDKMFIYSLGIGGVVCVVGYVVCILISKPILKIIYPDFAEPAMEYIIYTTGVAVLTALISLLNPFIMKFFDMKWQIRINGITALVYITLSLEFLFAFGLLGFCIGALITYILKVTFMIFIYFKCCSASEEKGKNKIGGA
ncbi:MAG: hypothetical protein IKS10_09520 [Lachnospiraceae bacterium]|nr:hypothetical protein [Lachnospiraceae bacterium]